MRSIASSSAGAAVTPIAIVGIGCRFPGGVVDADSFWRLLSDQQTGIVEVPAERWNLARYFHPDRAAAGGMASRWGGFIDTLSAFDARFWGIAPREAVRMDPQQRWLLEVAWEAIEDAGVAPARLRSTSVGVFVGISGNDHGGLQLGDAEHIDAYVNSGNTASIAANRISYMLDLRGPSVSVDTACSSSLVALSLACESLWSGRCDAALAGGVNALISPAISVGFSKAAMLSPSGRCYSFDARADGYVRAEGAGMVVLKPLARALADGDRVYAVVLGTAVNQDGHTSSMTVPSVEGQEAMLRAAYAQAGVMPSKVAYVEAHGTGTPVGDPIEATALGRVVGVARPSGDRCPIGSLKTNIGHLESASGIAGLIKAALVAYHQTIPASLNFERPNPQIDFDTLGLTVAADSMPLIARDDSPAIVGVNSFGFGGTNAHVVLQSPPTPPAIVSSPSAVVTHGPSPDRPVVLPISALDESALRAYVQRFRERLEDATTSIGDLCTSAGARKDHHSHRLAVIGASRDELRTHARLWLRDGRSAGVISGRAVADARPVFVFTGQGAQWWAMGRGLLRSEPIVQRRIDAIDARLRAMSGWSLIEELERDEASSRIDRTDIAQPALFALQVALCDLWRSWGIEPAAVVGHSVGEVAAAYSAGIYDLDTAIAIIFHRSRLQQTTQGLGRMLAAAIDVDEARRLLQEVDEVEIAAINSATLVTLSGNPGGLEDVERTLTARGIFTRWVRIAYAFHSYQMDPLRPELLAALASIQPRRSTVPFISTVTGAEARGPSLDGHYWWANVRQPVQFAAAISSLIRDGHQLFLEIGPHPALETAVNETLASHDTTGAVFHSLRRDADDLQELTSTVAALYVRGAAVDWQAINRGSGAFVALPSYPWQRESFWFEPPASAERRLAAPVHPLLGTRVNAALPTWETSIDLHRLPYLADHRIWDRVVFPASAFAEIGFAVAVALFPDESYAIEDLALHTALFLSENSPTPIQVVFTPEERRFAIYSAGSERSDWQLHASGTLFRNAASARPDTSAHDRLRASGQFCSRDDYRRRWALRGYQFGPSFQLVEGMWYGNDQALIEIAVPPGLENDRDQYLAHPALLDACFHLFLGLQMSRDEGAVDGLYLPELIARIRLHEPIRWTRLMAHGQLVSDDRASLVAHFRMTDAAGRIVADIDGFRAARINQLRTEAIDDCFYQYAWEPRHLRGSQADGICPFAASADILDAVHAGAADLREHCGLDEYHRSRGAEDDLVCRLVLQAFHELGWKPQRGGRFTLADLLADLRIVDEHQRLTRRLLEDLAKHGWVRSVGADNWELLRLPELINIEGSLDRLAADHPRLAPDVDLLRLVASQLSSVLLGELDAMALLFPNGSTAPLERFYVDAVAFGSYLEALRRAMTRALAELPNGRAIRVLEVGGGTGSLTRTMLSVLHPARTEYCFTDIGPAFLAAARTRFADYPFIQYQSFDLDIDPRSQGFADGSFDLIVASDALHTAADLRATLGNLLRCLAPGGMLMFMELVTRDFPLLDVTFGLLKGWWHATDHQLRRDTPLLDCRQWLTLLAECGFDAPATDFGLSDPTRAEHATFVARRPARPLIEEQHRESGQRYLLLADTCGVAEALAAELVRRGHEVQFAATEALDRRGGFTAIVDCQHLDQPRADELTLARLHEAQERGVLRAFRLVQSVAERATPVWFVTRNLHAITTADRADGLASAPLIGLARVANTEHQCRFFMVDLDDCAATDAARHLASEVTLPRDGEFETAYRDGVRHALRLRRTPPDALPQRRFDVVAADGTQHAFRLQSDKPGVLANLTLRHTPRPAPRPHEIEVRVHAGGLNFRDVMKALGTLPVSGPDRLSFGDDFAGTVERVGAGVTAFTPGDEVAGTAPGAFRSFAITDARIAFGKPANLSFEAAATVPTVFLTAQYALHHVAQMQPGERVLIHAGAGGVGLAAIQIAKRLSLEIFATAGTPEKRALLHSLGVPHVMSSRTLDFADEVMEITGGRGVDAVLNSLAGEFIPKSLAVLAPFGRFLEIGKADIFKNTKIGLRLLRNNISYCVLDLTQHVLYKPDLVSQIFHTLAAQFAAGELQPLPYTSFPIADVVGAFRHMAQGKHIGKNVLTFDPHGVQIGFDNDRDHLFRGDATYLITGGAGGFGLSVAEWIATHGGRHIVLMSRSGPAPEAQDTIDRLRSTGITISDLRGDVASAADVTRVVESIPAAWPLKGIFHAAMVIDDEFVAKQDDERVRRVLAPKMAGAWNLHVATNGQPLEHFVCFSSFSNVIGVPKQASYNAGNAFLDQLAHYRRAQGLPALAVNFGALLGAGFVERDRQTGVALATLGLGAFQLDEALQALERLLFVDGAQAAAARVDWNAVLRLSPLAGTSATYHALLSASREEESRGTLVARLRVATHDHRARLVQDFIVAQVAGVFGMTEDRIDRAASLTTLGLDSLMILELTNRVEREVGLRIPMASLLSGPTVVELSQTVLRLLAPTLATADASGDDGARATTTIGTSIGRALDSGGHILPLHRGDAAPIFAFHPVGGGVGIYAAMGPGLGPGATLFGVESRLKRGADREYATLDEMVERYADAVREASAPPYRLFGFSLGGYLAARVAERMEADGLDVDAVGVVDWGVTHTATPEARREGLIQLSIAGYLFAQQDIGLVRALTPAELRDQIAPIVDAILDGDAADGERFWTWIVERRLVVSPALEAPAKQQLTRFEQHCLMLSKPCPLPRVQAPLAVWRAARGFGSGLEAWQHRGSMSRDYTVDADHNAIVGPDSLQIIAAQFAAFLVETASVPAVMATARGRDT